MFSGFNHPKPPIHPKYYFRRKWCRLGNINLRFLRYVGLQNPNIYTQDGRIQNTLIFKIENSFVQRNTFSFYVYYDFSEYNYTLNFPSLAFSVRLTSLSISFSFRLDAEVFLPFFSLPSFYLGNRLFLKTHEI